MSFSLGRIFGVALLVSPLFAASSVRSAERFALPSATPITYAWSCDAYGAGYFTVPGSDLCLRIGGMVLSELDLRHVPLNAFTPNPGTAVGAVRRGPAPSTVGGGFGAGVTLDAWLPTEAGPVRGFVSATSVFGAGLLSPNAAGVYSPQADLGGYDPNAWRNFTRLDQAWLQFAGWTAGRAQSIFDFYADAWNLTPLRGSNARTEMLAFRFQPTPGVMAALALENNRERRNLVGQAVNPLGSADYAGAARPTRSPRCASIRRSAWRRSAARRMKCAPATQRRPPSRPASRTPRPRRNGGLRRKAA